MACSALWETPNQTRSDKGDNPETTHVCKQKQVQLPASTETSTQEVGADVKESGLFSDAGHLEDAGLTFQSSSPPFSAVRGFYKEGEGNRTKRWREGLRSSLHADEHGPFR